MKAGEQAEPSDLLETYGWFSGTKTNLSLRESINPENLVGLGLGGTSAPSQGFWIQSCE